MASFHRTALGTVRDIAVLSDMSREFRWPDVPFPRRKPAEIRAFLRDIRFARPVDGRGLGAMAAGSVYFLLAGGRVAKYLVLANCRYIVRDGDWGNMLPLTAQGQKRMRQELAL